LGVVAGIGVIGLAQKHSAAAEAMADDGREHMVFKISPCGRDDKKG